MNKIKKQFCLRGHDTFICGRRKRGNCRFCYNEDRKIAYRNRTDEQYEKERIRNRDYARQRPEISRKRYLENRSAKIAAATRWQAEHKQERLEYLRKYRKNRESIDPSFKLASRLRSRIRAALKGNFKVGSAVRQLGCSIEFLKSHLESKFFPGMSWDNWGYGDDKWNIDHILPLSGFNLLDPIQFKQAVHYTNLQPLWQVDNIKKGGINRVS